MSSYNYSVCKSQSLAGHHPLPWDGHLLIGLSSSRLRVWMTDGGSLAASLSQFTGKHGASITRGGDGSPQQRRDAPTGSERGATNWWRQQRAAGAHPRSSIEAMRHSDSKIKWTGREQKCNPSNKPATACLYIKLVGSMFATCSNVSNNRNNKWFLKWSSGS